MHVPRVRVLEPRATSETEKQVLLKEVTPF